MRIVSAYLLREFGKASGVVLAALFVLWFSGDTLVHVDEFGSQGWGALREIGLRSLDMIPVGVPLACLAGIVFSISRSARAREITAIRCGGIPLRRALLPVLATCVGVGVLVAVLEDRILVPARRALHELAPDTELEDGRHRSRPRKLGDRYWYASGSSLFSAEDYVPAEQRLEQVSVFVHDAHRRPVQRIEAAVARHVSGSVWEFHDARIVELEGPEGVTERRAKALRVDLGVTGEDMENATPPVSATSLRKLRRRLEREPGPPERHRELEVALHARLAQPLAVLVLVLFALPLAIGDVERGDSLPRAMIQAVIAAGLYWTGWTLALVAGGAAPVSAALPIWGYTALALGLGAWRFAAVRE